MRRPELALVLLALVLCQAPRGPGAPVPGGGGTVLAKMYPRGNHWAVGHLMGKKSTGESPDALEGDDLNQQLQEYIQWKEAMRNLLGLLEAKRNRSHQPPRLQALGNHQTTWDTDDRSHFKDVGSRQKVGRHSAPGSQGEGKTLQLSGQ
ncbi:PREDICTED: gastrin-releasing peptide isoform X1 [Dipodomys ordii]|uniref:Gastrin-releasing peptide n=1 Tax=Dipodomys ordii TaxID=10020 RepID=A0A1S3FDP6_DIPOR|nr:PREDICTED: gastrin-releasing peptide isoform X1 [Dipodomys ordii]